MDEEGQSDIYSISEQDFKSQDVLPCRNPPSNILTYNVDSVQTPNLYILPPTKYFSINKHVALKRTQISINPLIFSSKTMTRYS